MYRKATAEDTKAVYDLICDMEAKQLPYDAFSDIFEKQVMDDDYYCLLREEDGKVISELNLRFEMQLHHADRIAEIMEFAVDPGYRNKGIGAEVLAEAERIAKEAGCVQIEVACNQLRKDTHRFYEREGMNNFHFKFSKPLTGEVVTGNVLGR
jgi:PhnO protein